MLKIMHLIDDPALGGVNRLLESLMTALSDAFHHDKLLVRTRYSLPPRFTADVIVVHFTMAWDKLPFLLALRQLHRSARIILVEHSYTAAFEHYCVKTRRRFRRLLRLAYRQVDHLVAVSQGQARWLLEARLIEEDRLAIIPCVLDLAPFRALPPPAKHSGPLRLGAFGRFHSQKAFDLLVEAMRFVSPKVAQLELAGYGEEEGNLRALAANMENVTITGRVSPVAFLSRMDALVMPSRWEAGAVTCWEARAASRPMIVSAVDGLPEQVPPSVGEIVPPEHVGHLAAAILRLAAADRSPMAAAARTSTDGAFEEALESWRQVLRG